MGRLSSSLRILPVGAQTAGSAFYWAYSKRGAIQLLPKQRLVNRSDCSPMLKLLASDNLASIYVSSTEFNQSIRTLMLESNNSQVSHLLRSTQFRFRHRSMSRCSIALRSKTRWLDSLLQCVVRQVHLKGSTIFACSRTPFPPSQCWLRRIIKIS